MCCIPLIDVSVCLLVACIHRHVCIVQDTLLSLVDNNNKLTTMHKFKMWNKKQVTIGFLKKCLEQCKGVCEALDDVTVQAKAWLKNNSGPGSAEVKLQKTSSTMDAFDQDF